MTFIEHCSKMAGAPQWREAPLALKRAFWEHCEELILLMQQELHDAWDGYYAGHVQSQGAAA